MTQTQRKIAALKSAVTAAEASLANVVDVLVVLEDAYPTPAPLAIEQMKARFGEAAQRWTEARNYADQELRNLERS